MKESKELGSITSCICSAFFSSPSVRNIEQHSDARLPPTVFAPHLLHTRTIELDGSRERADADARSLYSIANAMQNV